MLYYEGQVKDSTLIGVLEYRSDGVLECLIRINLANHCSITPSLQHSIWVAHSNYERTSFSRAEESPDHQY